MAELDDDTGVDVTRCHANGFVVIADDAQQFVASVLELHEELHHGEKVLRRCEEADRNVMREVIDAVDERDLLLVAFYRHILPIDHQEATETFGVAVGEGDLVVVRQRIQFVHNAPVSCINAFADAGSESPRTRALEMGE